MKIYLKTTIQNDTGEYEDYYVAYLLWSKGNGGYLASKVHATQHTGAGMIVLPLDTKFYNYDGEKIDCPI